MNQSTPLGSPPRSSQSSMDAYERNHRAERAPRNLLANRSINASPEPTRSHETSPTRQNLTMFGISGLDVPSALSDQSLEADTFVRTPPPSGRRLCEAELKHIPQLTPAERKASLSSDSASSGQAVAALPPQVLGLDDSPHYSDGGSTVKAEPDTQAQAPRTEPSPLAPRPAQAEFSHAEPVNFSARHLGWGLKGEPARVRRLLAPDAPHIEELLRERFNWNSSLRDLEIEFVSRAQVRSYLHFDCGLTPTMSWLLSWALPMHYSPSLPSLSSADPGEALRPGRLLVVAPNAWWLSDSQLHYQLCQMMVLAAAHRSVPATFDRLQVYHTQPRIAAYLNDGLGGLLWGLTEVVATHFSVAAQRAQHTLAPWTWWHARTLWQRTLQWLLSFFAKSELSPRNVGRQIASQLAKDVETSPHIIARSLEMPGATVAIRAPAGEGAVARLKPDEARDRYPRDLFRSDVKFWERYNPLGGAIGYSFDDGSRFEKRPLPDFEA